MKEIIAKIRANKHTSIAGVIIALAAFAEIWFPKYSEQLHKTREAAMAYGFLLAGDSKKDETKDETKP